MCPIPKSDGPARILKPSTRKKPGSTCFNCTKLNDTTFQIVEDDQWDELPIIYVKVYDAVLVVIDTGCGGAARDKSAELTSLREFLETYPVPDNKNTALNPKSEKDYIIICSHCHFDHIGGISQFQDAPKSAVWASGYDRDFVEGDDKLATNSLCQFFGMSTPEYKVTVWAEDGQSVVYGPENIDLNLVIYHTPGHTPDELAVWDSRERVLFVGDTLYEWTQIVWPLEGNLLLYSNTMAKLKSLVHKWNSEPPITTNNDSSKCNENQSGLQLARTVKIACGHTTSAADGQQILDDVDSFLYHVAEGVIEENSQGTFRDEPLVSYNRVDGKIRFRGPRKLFETFRSDEIAMEGIRSRQS